MSGSRFEFRRAEGPEDLERVHRLRFQVYVAERGFEDPAAHPGGLERDGCDGRSVHLLALRDGATAGTVRLVQRQGLALPLETRCPEACARLAPLGEAAAEISRLAVSRAYRRRRDDQAADGTPPSPPHDPERRRGPEIVLGLFKLLYRESLRLGLTHWCAAMERSLVLLLRRTHIEFEQLGPEVDYHGRRAPYLLEIARMERVWLKRHPDLYAEFGGPRPRA